MKFSLEIDGDEVKYEWKLGASCDKGKVVARAHHFHLISQAVQELARARNSESGDMQSELIGRAWVGKSPDEAQKIIDKIKSKEKI